MKKKYGIYGSLLLATTLLFTTGCSNDNLTKLNDKNAVTIQDHKISLDKLKEKAEIDNEGKLSVTEGLLTDVLKSYYFETVDEEQLKKTTEMYVKSLQKASKEKISDKTKEEVENTVRKSYLIAEAQNDLIEINPKEVQKEYDKGYNLVRVVYAVENGMGNDKSSKEISSLEKELKNAKNEKAIQKISSKYSKSNLITVGTLVVSKDVTNFDDDLTKKILSSKKGEVFEWKSKDSTSTKNIAFTVDTWKASTSEIAMYKKARLTKELIPNNFELLKQLDEKYNDLEISKKVYEILENEQNGISSLEKDKEKAEK